MLELCGARRKKVTIDLRAQHGHDGAYCCADHRARDADMRGERDRGRSCCGAGDNLRNGKSLEQLLLRRNRLGLSDKLFLFALVDTGATTVGVAFLCIIEGHGGILLPRHRWFVWGCVSRYARGAHSIVVPRAAFVNAFA